MVTIPKLRAVISQNYRKLQPYRKNSYEAVRQYVGRHYTDDGTSDRVPMNYIQLAVQIYGRMLTSRMPQVTVNTKNQELKHVAARAQRLANAMLKEIDFGSKVREWVNAGMFGMGILKVGWAQTDIMHYTTDAQEEIQLPVGRTFVDPILLDDWVQDLQSKGKPWEHCSFMGHKYRMSLDQAQAFPDWNEDARKSLVELVESRTTEGGDPKLGTISGSYNQNSESIREEVEIWEIYLPDTNEIVTFAADGDSSDDKAHSNEPLNITKWQGPKQGPCFSGPYHFLGFDWPIGQSMPVPPVAHWRDVHELANQILNKNARKALRQKTVFGFQSGHDEDARRQREAGDGDMVQMNDPNSVKVFETPGIDQQLLSYGMSLDNIMDKIGGNLSALGGLGPQSETVGQDRMALGQANTRVDDMRNETFEAVTSVCKSLLYYWWNDPVQDFEDVVHVSDSIQMPFNIAAESRGEIWHELNFDVRPYSMQHSTPEQRAQFVLELVNNPNMMQMLQESGKMFDMDKIISLLSEYNNIPELMDVIVNQDGQPMMGQESVGQKPGSNMPTNTTRTYERVSRPGATDRGQNQMMQQMLAAQGNQQPQMNSGSPQP